MKRDRISRVFWKTLQAMIGLVLSIVSWLLNIHIWSNIGISVGLLITGAVIYYYFYQYEGKIDAFEDSRPNIIPSARCDVFPIFSEDLEKPNQAWFALVEFRNQPIEPIEKSVAKDVSALITYYDKDLKSQINNPGISGRWWSNEEIVRSNKPRTELERTVILPNTQPVILALACMSEKDSAIYAYNNENHQYKDFKKLEFSLGLGIKYVHVTLSGINLPPINFWFSISRDTISMELKIKQIDKPKGIR